MNKSKSRVLEGVICVVDTKRLDNKGGSVISSTQVSKDVVSLGGTVVVELSDKTTHLVYSNPKTTKPLSQSQVKKALQIGITVVSPEWIEDCKKQKKKANSSKYVKEKWRFRGLYFYSLVH